MHGVATLVSFTCFLGMISFNHKVHTEHLLFLIVSLSIPLSMLTMDWLYQGLEEYVYITLRSLAFTTLSVISLFLFVHQEGDYVINAVIVLVASLGSSILNFWNARKIVFAHRDRPWEFRRHLKPLSVLYAFNFIVSIYINLDTVMLGFLSTARSVGYYSSSIKLTKMLLSLVTSFGVVLLPRLSYYLSKNMRQEFDRMLKKSLEIILLLCMPITVALMLISREILLALAGETYLPAATCVVITAPIILFIGLTNIFGLQILYPLGKEKEVVLSVGVGAVVAATLDFILIPRYDHFGAAWGTLIAECAVLIVQLILVRRSYEIHWPWKNITKYVMATAIMSCLLLLVRWNIPESRLWVRLLIDVPVGAGTYFFVLHVMHEEVVLELILKMKGRYLHA